MGISKGVVTYESEGTEGGPYHSRVLHVPGNSSGLTIGRGYDMKQKTAEKIVADLTAAGVDHEVASKLAKASGLAGSEAKAFIEDNDLQACEISIECQEKLFVTTYQALEKDVQRICDKPDCVKIYGAVDWDALEPKIKDIIIDLRYRGDYTSRSRKRIQKFVADNDLQHFIEALINRDQWSDVPEGRFNQRATYLLSDSE